MPLPLCIRCTEPIPPPRLDRKMNPNRELCDACRVVRQRERNRDYMARVAKKKRDARQRLQASA